MYGMRSQAAGLDTLAKAMMVARIPTHRRIISAKAPPGFLRPKKIADHRRFRMSCRAKIPRAILTSWRCQLFCHTRKAAIPIKAKSVVQTGAKSQLGGATFGFTRLAYQVGMAGVVNMAPITPASSQPTIAMVNLPHLPIFIFLLYYL